MRMLRQPVSAQARGQVRVLCFRIAEEADQLTRTVAALPPVMVQSALGKDPTGSRAALKRILRRMPVAPVWIGPRRQIAWRFLRPLADPDDVEMAVVLLNAVGRPPVSIEQFGMRFSRHALGRLLDRSTFKANPVSAMNEAHSALLSLDPAEGERLFSLGRLILPAVGGGFLTVPHTRHGNDPPMAQAQTWIPTDATWDNQSDDLAAWADFLASTKNA